MAQRVVEMLIGRLVTDEAFRTEFLAFPETVLLELCDRGLELSRIEMAALVGTDRSVWMKAAAGVDPRLQKTRLPRASEPV